jgi:hypothetical protein
MADPGHHTHDKEQAFEAITEDPVVAVENTNHEEPSDSDNNENEEKDYIEMTSHRAASDSGSGDLEKRPAVDRTKSYATDASAVSSHVDAPVQKPWYKNINPLRWGKIPPVPKTRTVSREYNANFFSMIYFQWMAPMMSVSARKELLSNYCILMANRLDTDAHSSLMIFGLSTPIDRQMS